MTSAFTNFLASLEPDSRIFIQTHNFPDPDAMGSAHALRELLAHYGIYSQICHSGEIESIGLRYILDAYQIPRLEACELEDIKEEDKIILVDGQKFNTNMTDLPGVEIGCIDHHPLNRKACIIASYEYLDVRPVGACASIITDYYSQLGIPISQQAATMLLYGLQIDTGNFQRGVTPLDIAAFNTLFHSADQDMLKSLSGKNLRSEDLKAFGVAIKDIRISSGLGIVKIPFSCPDYLVARVADFILSLNEVDTSIVYSQSGKGFKFSARTLDNNVHCGQMLKEVLASLGGSGGGHNQMAGGFIPESHEDADLEAAFLKFLQS